MSRPILAHIDRQALRHNLNIIRQRAPTSRVMAVVKANAYGHGLQTVLPALDTADSLAVASMEEALQLRHLGWNKPILLLEGVFEISELKECIAQKLSVVVHQPEQVQMLLSQSFTTPLQVFVKLNSGMNRLGLDPETYHASIQALRQAPMLSQLTQISHFATADETRGVSEQMRVIAPHFAAHPYPISLANSAAIFHHPDTHHQWVRPGIALYGASPFQDIRAEDLQLKPVMTLHSRIIAIQTLQANQAVGYGQNWVANSTTRVGIVACGYADGYPRHAGTGTPILVENQRTHTLGRVSMDMLCVDLTGIPNAQIGSPVVLWGKGLPVEQVAQAAGTLNYELLCARAQRVPEQST
jgi:alanine racemase